MSFTVTFFLTEIFFVHFDTLQECVSSEGYICECIFIKCLIFVNDLTFPIYLYKMYFMIDSSHESE